MIEPIDRLREANAGLIREAKHSDNQVRKLDAELTQTKARLANQERLMERWRQASMSGLVLVAAGIVLLVIASLLLRLHH